MRRFPSGQTFIPLASEWNDIADAVDFCKALKAQRQQGQLKPNANVGLVLIRNDSGSDQNRFAVLGIYGVVISPNDNQLEFQNMPALAVGMPAAAQYGRFVVLAEPIVNGSFGYAHITGVVPVQVSIVAVEYDYADITAGETYLTADIAGAARIIYKDDESVPGTQWCYVVLNETSIPRLYKATSAPFAGEITIKALQSNGSTIGSDLVVKVVT